MPALKKSERNLLVVFLAALFLVANFLLYTQISGVQRRADTQVRRLELELLEMSDLLAEKQMWEVRGSWLETHQPVFDSEGVRGMSESELNLDLLNTVRSESGKLGIELKGEKLLEREEHPHYVQAVVSLQAVGTIEALMRWIFILQKPDQFRAVTSFRLKPEKDDPSVLECNIKVERWYAKAGPG